LDTVETLVVGAGVVGLAVAWSLARAGHEVIVVDQADAIGSATSSRSSEVIHAGIYYPPGSLKARLCVEGKDLLYRFCRERGVTAKRIGKLIVAVNDAETGKLEALHGVAGQNGVHDLTWLSPEDVAALEPDVRCARALLSPSTGIVDSHAFMLTLQGEAEARGAMVALSTSFRSATIQSGAIHVTLDAGGGEVMALMQWLTPSPGLIRHICRRAFWPKETIAPSPAVRRSPT
jgi:L-2-hydroxyglutarate oxidase LhgO